MVPRRRWGPGRRQARARWLRRLQMEPFRSAPHQLHREHELRPGRAVDRHAQVRLAREPRRNRAVLRDSAPPRQHGGRRGGRAAGVDSLLDPQARPPGHRFRGAPRRQGDLRPERLAARRRPKARSPQEHSARAGAEPAPSRRGAASRGRFVEVAVPLYYQGHAYRTGSRIRVTIAAPGGDQPVWAFGEVQPRGGARVSVARSRAMPSRLLLPVVPGVDVPTGLPPCPGLRGEACRS